MSHKNILNTVKWCSFLKNLNTKHRHFVSYSDQIYSVSYYKNKKDWEISNLNKHAKIGDNFYTDVFSILL